MIITDAHVSDLIGTQMASCQIVVIITTYMCLFRMFLKPMLNTPSGVT